MCCYPIDYDVGDELLLAACPPGILRGQRRSLLGGQGGRVFEEDLEVRIEVGAGGDHVGSRQSVAINQLAGSGDGGHRPDEVYHGKTLLVFCDGVREAAIAEIALGRHEGNLASKRFDERFLIGH